MSIDDVKATIRQGNEAIEAAKATIERAAAEALDATHLAQQTLKGSRHDDVKAGLCRLAEAAHEVELTLRRVTASTENANAYLAALG